MDGRYYLEQYDNGNPSNFGNHDITIKELRRIKLPIANIIIGFNSLETNLDSLIVDAVDQRSHIQGYALVSALPTFSKKVEIFKALYGPIIEYRGHSGLKNGFKKLVRGLFEIKDIRNDIAHADWSSGTAQYEFRLRLSIDEGGPYAFRKIMTPDYLTRQIKKIDALTKLVDKFEVLLEDTA